MPVRRPHSLLTTAGAPLVRIEIDADPSNADRWEEARKVDAEAMDFAVPIRALPLTDGRVRIEFAVDPDEYAVGLETSDGYAEAYIEMLLNLEASLILDDEDDEEIDYGPSEPPNDDGVPF